MQAAVDVSGPVDLTVNHDADGDAFFASLLGGTQKQKPQAWRDASPVFDIGKDTAPFLIVHGARDADVPIAQSVEFANALTGAGVDVTLIQVDDVHTFTTDAARKRLALETLAFFNRTLK